MKIKNPETSLLPTYLLKFVCLCWRFVATHLDGEFSTGSINMVKGTVLPKKCLSLWSDRNGKLWKHVRSEVNRATVVFFSFFFFIVNELFTENLKKMVRDIQNRYFYQTKRNFLLYKSIKNCFHASISLLNYYVLEKKT